MTSPVASALMAAAGCGLPAPVPAVPYYSQGRVLVIGASADALEPARILAASLPVTLLLEDGADFPADEEFPVLRGEIERIVGWLGAFTVSWRFDDASHQGEFDLVLNLTSQRYFTMHQPPQGYFFPQGDAEAMNAAMADILDGSGEFEKPKFFLYNAKTCAHSRSRLEGCSRCIEVCSTEAISAAGDHIRVEPHLCMGCGACATVCPSGAMQYNFPAMSYWGDKLKLALEAYHAAGGRQACVLLHNPDDGAALVRRVALPGNVIPLEVFHTASIGLDWLLGAVTLGAAHIAIVTAGSEAPQYLEALREQMALGETILHGLGYDGMHFSLVTGADAMHELDRLPPAEIPTQQAGFRWFDEKRTTLDFCLEHLVRHAPMPIDAAIPLPEHAPFGEVVVDGGRCTLCFSCVGACPAAALQDGAGLPALKFIERNCVQCGLCENACPEDAIELVPRLLLAAGARQARVLHEDAPFPCVRCGKPFGTTSMVGSMLRKLSGHSMFATPEARRRLQMCGDCRVIDMMENNPAMLEGR